MRWLPSIVVFYDTEESKNGKDSFKVVTALSENVILPQDQSRLNSKVILKIVKQEKVPLFTLYMICQHKVQAMKRGVNGSVDILSKAK